MSDVDKQYRRQNGKGREGPVEWQNGGHWDLERGRVSGVRVKNRGEVLSSRYYHFPI